MTTHATPLRSFVLEPFELAIGQPHQFLISSASVSIVALEAATLVPWPFNVGLAIGAEWAYLRGLITGAGVKTRWAAALNWAAVILVFGYGGLWGFRSFHLIPETPAPWLAVLLTIVHIGTIGAVTICSAMLHRASMDAQAAAQHLAQQVADEQVARDAEYQRDVRRQRDAIQLEAERAWRQAQIANESARVRLELKAAVRAQTRSEASGTATNSGANSDREQLRAQIARTLREQPDANRSELARSLGIGRTLLYDLVNEAKDRGELA